MYLTLISLILGCGKPYLQKEPESIKPNLEYNIGITCTNSDGWMENPIVECHGYLEDGNKFYYNRNRIQTSHDYMSESVTLVTPDGDLEFYEDFYRLDNICPRTFPNLPHEESNIRGTVRIITTYENCEVASEYSLVDNVAYFRKSDNHDYPRKRTEDLFHTGNTEETKKFISLVRIARSSPDYHNGSPFDSSNKK